MYRFKVEGQIYKHGTFITPSGPHQVGYQLYELIEARMVAHSTWQELGA